MHKDKLRVEKTGKKTKKVEKKVKTINFLAFYM